MRGVTLLLAVAGIFSGLTNHADAGLFRHRARRCCTPRTLCRPCPAACGCPSADSGQATQPEQSAPDQDVFLSPLGVRHKVIHTDQVDPEDAPPTEALLRSPRAAEALREDLDKFQGTARRAAKTSIADAPRTDFENIVELLENLPSDDDMIHHDPRISSSATSDRVEEERLNVRVPAFLYAASKEEDNDFHIILGDTPEATDSTTYMNVELSGLPPSGHPDHSRLSAVRQFYLNSFQGILPGHRYDFYDPPIPVRVSGSVFYDIDHRPGLVGPSAHRPNTSWEIHPITFLDFSDE